MDHDQLETFMDEVWRGEPGREGGAVSALSDYIRIPNASPAFDPRWAENGHTDRAVEVLLEGVARLKETWRARNIAVDDIATTLLGGIDHPELDPNGHRRTPLIVVDLPAFGPSAPQGTVLFYGHCDKQPETLPWSEGLGPRIPVLRNDKLYGRGGGDDGYALFGAFSAVMALRAQGVAHARSVILIEAGEESGSPDLPHYLETLKARLGDVTLVVCLDSGCGDYDQLWITQTLRGVVNLWLDIRVLREGVHSGDASGVVPSCFRILRRILSRVEDEATGTILPPELSVDLPPEVVEQARRVAQTRGTGVYDHFPFANADVRPVDDDPVELILNRTWRTQLSVTGMQGLPTTEASAGNVLLPNVRAKLSFRLPPTLDAEAAAAFLRRELTRDPPYHAEIAVSEVETGQGWAAPAAEPWLSEALQRSSRRFFGRPDAEALYFGEGGSIPLVNTLATLFPRAGFVVTGVLGPHANAHGPDEFLHLPTAARVSACMAEVLAAHGRTGGGGA